MAREATPLHFGNHERVEEGDLPAAQGKTWLVLAVVDPYAVHAFWEVTQADLGKARSQILDNSGSAQAILRFYEAGSKEGVEDRETTSFDINVDLRPCNWYVHLWSAGKSFCVELGLKGETGRFIPLATSNTAHTPRARPALKVKEQFLRVERGKAGEIIPAPASVRSRGRHRAPVSAAAARVGSAVRSAQPGDSKEVLKAKLAAFYRLRGGRSEPPKIQQPREGITTGRMLAEVGLDPTGVAEDRLITGLSSATLKQSRPER